MMVNPVGVRDGDVLIIGGDVLSEAEQDELCSSIHRQIGVALHLLFIPGCRSAIVLRPEVAADQPLSAG